MNAFGGTFTLDLVKLIFFGTAIANLADNAASSPITNLQVALHTADPGAGGDQTTNEVSFTPYARVAVARLSSSWVQLSTVADIVSIVNAADITFAKPTAAAGQIATYASFGFVSSGASKIIFRSQLHGPLTMIIGNAPRLVRGSSFTLGSLS